MSMIILQKFPDKEELVWQAHSIVRHPDMPKVLFKILQ